MSKHTIESLPPHSVWTKQRLVVRGFRTSDEMHGFLNKDDNGLRYKVSDKGLKPGTYVFAGGRWHNVKSLDSVALAHL